MKSLGYSATWRTKCFLGCTRTVWAHTNGHGDFVLLNDLGWPWPIHECYSASGNLDGEPTGIDRNGEKTTPVTPESFAKKRHTSLATITSVTRGALGADSDFAALPKETQSGVRKALDGRSSLVTFVDGGDGGEYSAFIDLKKMPVGFRDIVAVDIKTLDLPTFLNRRAFVVTRLEVLCPASHA